MRQHAGQGNWRQPASRLLAFVRKNRADIVDYNRARRSGKRISTASAESVTNHVINRRMSKGQQMRWSISGAQRLCRLGSRCLTIVWKHTSTRGSRTSVPQSPDNRSCRCTHPTCIRSQIIRSSTLIIRALGSWALAGRRRLAVVQGLGATGFAVGLALSALFDLPSGAVVIWALAGSAPTPGTGAWLQPQMPAA